jgi:hypothetical protein
VEFMAKIKHKSFRLPEQEKELLRQLLRQATLASSLDDFKKNLN